MDAGAEICISDKKGRTPTLVAARDGGFYVVNDLLLKDVEKRPYCIDMYADDAEGNTLMHYVAANDLDPKSQLIIMVNTLSDDQAKKGEDLDDIRIIENNKDQTPFEYVKSMVAHARDAEEKKVSRKNVLKKSKISLIFLFACISILLLSSE